MKQNIPRYRGMFCVSYSSVENFKNIREKLRYGIGAFSPENTLSLDLARKIGER